MTWREVVQKEGKLPYFDVLNLSIKEERSNYNVYPPNDQVFTAFRLTPFEEVKVVILGQDPYHGKGQAMGLSFSVNKGVRIPPSLVNIYKELEEDPDVEFKKPDHGDLTKWAQQGVLLLNSTLTVRESTPNSHEGFGWPRFTDRMISQLSIHREDIVFMLWGKFAQAKESLIDPIKHKVLTSAHPSPFSANRGFFGCQHFSKANQALNELGKTPIDWQL